MTQANSISGALASSFGLSPLAVGIAVATLAGVVILGGIKRLASVTERLVPFMAVTYTLGGVLIICLNWRGIPAAFSAILSDAFTLRAAGEARWDSSSRTPSATAWRAGSSPTRPGSAARSSSIPPPT